MKKILVGGHALVELGSSRSTSDVDYLVCEADMDLFTADESQNCDYINAAKSDFFMEIFEIEKENEIASPQSLLELKAYAFVQHCQNFNFQKADDCEYDMKFLVRNFNLKGVDIVSKYLSKSELKEVQKIILSTKK
jgi:hypothetical protein